MNLKKVKSIRDYVCKGCKTYVNPSINNSKKILVCYAPHKKNGHVCPCSECLVKMICEIKCDKFHRYIKKDTYDIKKSKTWAIMKKTGGRFGGSSFKVGSV